MSSEDRWVNEFVICRIYLSAHTCDSKISSRYFQRNKTSSVFSRVISQLNNVQYFKLHAHKRFFSLRNLSNYLLI